MRKAVIASGCAAVGVALGVLGSPVARADDAEFVREAQAMGFFQASDNLISQAESVCYFFLRKRSVDDIEARIVRYTRIDPPSLAHPFMALAVRTYCPQYSDLIGP